VRKIPSRIKEGEGGEEEGQKEVGSFTVKNKRVSETLILEEEYSIDDNTRD